MTDPRGVHSGHLDAATIAALVDRTLDPAARAAVEAHLSTCADCREVWVETSEVVGDPEAGAHGASAPASAPRARSRRWVYGGAGLAAAAAVLFAVSLRTVESDTADAVERLAIAMGSQRTTLGRLSGPFEWGSPPEANRGGAESQLSLDARDAANSIERLAAARNAESLAAFGKAQLALGHVDRAVTLLSEAARLSPASPDTRSDLAVAYIERWRLEDDAAALVQALDEVEKALSIDAAHLPALFNRAHILQGLRRASAARLAWQQYLERDATSPWSDEARRQLEQLKDARSRHRPDPTVEYRWLEQDALPAWGNRAHLSSLIPAEVVRVAETLAAEGRDRRAADLVQLLRESASWGDERRACLGSALSELATWSAAYESGRQNEASVSVERASAWFECASVSAPEVALYRLLTAAAAGAQLDDAELGRIADEAQTRGYYRIASRAQQLRGLAALFDVKFDEGIAHHLKGLELASRAADQELVAASATYLASTLDELGDRAAAWKHFTVALSHLDLLGSPRRRYQVVSNASLAAADAGWHGAVLSFARELLSQTQHWDNPVGQVVGELDQARAWASLDYPDRSSEAVDRAWAIARNTAVPTLRLELEAEVAATRGRVLVERDARRAAQALTDAIDYLERRGNRYRTAGLLLLRGRALRNLGDAAGAEADWLRGIALVEKQNPSLRDSRMRISRLSEVWDLFDELVDLRQQDPAGAIEVLERGLARELLDSIGSRRPLLREALLPPSWLDPLVEVLMYSTRADRVLIWRVNAKGVSQPLIRLVEKEALARMVEQQDTRALGDLLVPTLPPETRLLAVVPDGVLHGVAFPALQVSGSTLRLVDRLPVVVAPSLAVLRSTLQLDGTVGAEGAVLVEAAEARPQNSLPSLPGARAEVQTLRTVYPSAVVLRERHARWNDVRREIERARVVHFAGHAISDPVHPDRARLLLAPTDPHGPVNAADIAAVRMRPGAVVVLAACDTARGVVYRGEGAQSLARPFLAAGASAVLATLWPLNDSSGSTVLVDFHRQLALGRHPAMALAGAQRDAIARGVPDRAWAAFTLVGSPSLERLHAP